MTVRGVNGAGQGEPPDEPGTAPRPGSAAGEPPGQAVTNAGVRRLAAPFPAYTGADPYIFVSYAHADEVAVYAELTRLHQRGVRLWYDKGIPGGADWRSVLAERLESPLCAGMLFFLSPRSFESIECYREAACADDWHKKIVVISLEPVTLKGGLGMLLRPSNKVIKWEVSLAEFHAMVDAALPPEVGPARGARGPGEGAEPQDAGDRERELLVGCLVTVREPGGALWRSLRHDERVARGSRIRVLTHPETECHMALLVETRDAAGRPIDLTILDPDGTTRWESRHPVGIWDTIPRNLFELDETEPERVSSWRLGLIVTGEREPFAFRDLAHAHRPTAPSVPPSWRSDLAVSVRPSALPLTVRTAFKLAEPALAVTLEGRREMVHWEEVRFA